MASLQKGTPGKIIPSIHRKPYERRYMSPSEFADPDLADSVLEYTIHREMTRAEQRALKRSVIPSAR